MKIAYRQGIIKSRVDSNNVPTFLLKEATTNYITLYINASSTLITFAQGDVNYLYEESNTIPQAWGPFDDPTIKQYLYWDVDLITGIRTFGSTILEPIINSIPPSKPNRNQFWFNVNDNKMYVHDGYGWNEKLRVFAGTYQNSKVEPYFIYEPTDRLNGKKIIIQNRLNGVVSELSDAINTLNSKQLSQSLLANKITLDQQSVNDKKTILDGLLKTDPNYPTALSLYNDSLAFLNDEKDDLINLTSEISLLQKHINQLTTSKNELDALIAQYDGWISNGYKNYFTTQVGNYDESLAGFILFDDFNEPVKRSNGTFLSTESQFHTTKSIINSVNFDTELFYANAIENIPAYSAVSFYKDHSIALASYNDPEHKSAIGFIRTEVYKDEVSNVVTNGYITNVDWNFNEPPSTSLYLGLYGTFQTSPPTSGFIQKVGTIVSPDTILVNIDPQIIYNTDDHKGLSIPINVDIISGKLYTAQSADAVTTPIPTDPNTPIPENASTSQIAYTYVQNKKSRTWTMKHSKNTEHVFVQVFDSDGNYIIPNSIHTELNTITATFNEPCSGIANCILFLSTNYIILPNNNMPIYEFWQTSPSTIWTIEHYLGYYPITRVYIDDVNVNPESIIHIDKNKTQIIFQNPQQGLVKFL